MSQPRPLVDRTPAVHLLIGQLSIALCVMLMALMVSPRAAWSAGMGAGIAIAGSLYFTLRAFFYAGAADASRILQSFYKGEAGKFVITVLLFAAVFAGIKSVHIGWLLTGFILEQLAVFVVHLVETVRQGR